MGVEQLPRTIDIDENGAFVTIVDQTKLPEELVIRKMTTIDEMIDAIKELAVRGAPALGVAGAAGLALFAVNECHEQTLEAFMQQVMFAEMRIATARPTAVNLSWGAARALYAIREALKDDPFDNDADRIEAVKTALVGEACRLRDEDEASCRAIGAVGAEFLPEHSRVLTHCNAGSLACAFYGTALGVIYAADEQGKIERVYADETRPVGQGARLTAWELARAGVPVTLICDDMAASVMQRGMVDAVVVGADRICANGDVVNKIGTYGVAVLAAQHGIPFYVAAPTSTIDLNTAKGEDVTIEERSHDELGFAEIEGVDTINPAFDVTPAKLVSRIFTENGAFTSADIAQAKA